MPAKDSDAFLLGQEQGYDPVLKLIEEFSRPETQVMLTREMMKFLDTTKIPWDKGNVGVMLIRCA